MDWIDKKYTAMLATRLRNFKFSSPTVANFSCPICGDSTTHSKKARGYILSKKGSTYFFCHNCGASHSLNDFINTLDVNLAAEYRMEKFKDSRDAAKKQEQVDLNIFKTGVKPGTTPTINAPRLTTLPDQHPARTYIRTRLLDEKKFYFVENFPDWASTSFKTMARWSKVTPHPRIVLPVYDATKVLTGMVARAFNGETPKYAIIKLTDDELVYGMDRVNLEKRVWVVEGPYDSLMLDNAVAAMTSSLTRVKLPPETDVVYVFDNQPRNIEIVNLVEKSVFRGDQVVLWPDTFQYKDINEAIQGSITRSDINTLLTENVYKGLAARPQVGDTSK